MKTTCTQPLKHKKVQVLQVSYSNTHKEIFKKFLLYKVIYTTCMTCTPISDGRTRMREREIEKQFALEVKRRGGICPKLVAPGYDGMPDRLAFLPDGKLAFVEVKASGQKPRPLQLSRHRLLRSLGFPVYVLDDIEKIGGIIDEIQTT